MPQLRLLDVSRNQLTALPALFFPQIETIKAADNQLQALPNSVTGLATLAQLDVNSNLLEALPAGLIDLPLLSQLNLRRNLLDFADLEPIMGQLSGLLYTPQLRQRPDETIFGSAGSLLTISANIGGSANSYRWFKDGQELQFTNNSSFSFVVTAESVGVFTVRASNSLVPGLELSSRNITVLLECTTTREISLVTSSPLSYCAAVPISAVINAQVAGGDTTALSYQWYRGSTPIPLANSSSYFANAAGSYSVAVTGQEGCRSFSTPLTIELLETAEVSISSNGTDALEAAVSVEGGIYQWYLGSVAIAGAAGNTIVPNESGQYVLGYTLPNGCETFSNSIAFTVTGLQVNPDLSAELELYPVPVQDELHISLPYSSGALKRIVVRSAIGQQVLELNNLSRADYPP